eukprot:SAG31_NODE_1646_length_7649_cov_3.317616_9_plen_94_part_00
MAWQDPDHHEASYVGVMTGFGSTGVWHVCITPDDAADDDDGDAEVAYLRFASPLTWHEAREHCQSLGRGNGKILHDVYSQVFSLSEPHSLLFC